MILCCLFLVSDFQRRLTLFVYIYLVRFVLLSGHLSGKSCPLGWPYVLLVFLVIFCFGFEGGVWVLIAPVPVHRTLVFMLKDRHAC